MNSNDSLSDQSLLEQYRWPFIIAALMHDCGHAPYSHALEHYYEKGKVKGSEWLMKLTDADFHEDFSYHDGLEGAGGPAPHELFGAALFIDNFGDVFKDISGGSDPILVARMITGTKHRPPVDERKGIENSLISLINGEAIDMDKLDYIMRDSWASGVKNVAIDTQRLLSAVRLVKTGPKIIPAFNKSALSVIRNIVDGRNYLYRWIVGHHTVCYFQEVFDRASKQLMEKLSEECGQQVEDIIFSSTVFNKKVEINGRHFYLPADADFYVLLKEHSDQIPEVEELLSRTPGRIPLWKTSAEFNLIFEDFPDPIQIRELHKNSRSIIASIIDDDNHVRNSWVIPFQPKTKLTEVNKVNVAINDRVIKFEKAVPDAKAAMKRPEFFFYVYIPKEAAHLKKDCIQAFREATTSN